MVTGERGTEQKTYCALVVDVAVCMPFCSWTIRSCPLGSAARHCRVLVLRLVAEAGRSALPSRITAHDTATSEAMFDFTLALSLLAARQYVSTTLLKYAAKWGGSTQ